ncbi:serine/threonine-protein kinase [Lignipirellula cremea]|uniref:Serine/threonine-protein kinase PknD n=1 Tax=Lignipirellula cremea TaxID=2528010 RepID=A0A518DZX4_9BACT|nr:serine/threonine-protein kinase [Lignipirellula cremea]QDU97361.1 Serine/threonine-protein kinase PknD [Lignipirellula cremea]
MTTPGPQSYSGIYLSKTDTDLPDRFSNDFAKYSNFRELAGGGNGVLIACNDNNLGRKVVIKKLAPEHRQDARARRRLLREARVTAQLTHPNTVPVHEIGLTDEGDLYFTMKKIEGEDLFRILSKIARSERKANEANPLDELLGILLQASNALSYAHSRGVIHRDIKPENILVGMFGDVFLMDWGVAKVWGMPNEGSEDEIPRTDLHDRLTSPGKRPGTPLYMSPEQVRDKVVDERSDIFSMGVVLYETLALKEPFRGANINETFANILDYDPPPPSSVAKHWAVPKALDEICAKAMQKNPRDRYQMMREMIRDINRFRAEAIAAPPE